MTQVTCPVCNGTCRNPVGNVPYKEVCYGYDPVTDTLPCTNCGAQTMALKATGLVNLNKEGKPCTHSYVSLTIGNCLRQYTCKHCDYQYIIDSGD